MVGNKEMLVTDIFIVKHHSDSEKDRKVLDWIIKYFQKNLVSIEDYEPQYPECCNDPWPNPYVGKQCMVISDDCRLPKGTRCEVTQYISGELSEKNFYIRNMDSQYSCWAASQDLQFL